MWMKTRILFVLLFAAMFVIQPATYAKTDVPASPAAEKAATSAGETGGQPSDRTETETVEYALPYPGILPDHPLYFLKSFRDSIINLLITDPVKKAEFALLRSDKFVGMGTMLAEKGKWDLALETLGKSNQEMEKAVSTLTSLKVKSVTIPPHLVNSVNTSIAKHIDVLGGVKAENPVLEKVGKVVNELGELEASAQLLR